MTDKPAPPTSGPESCLGGDAVTVRRQSQMDCCTAANGVKG